MILYSGMEGLAGCTGGSKDGVEDEVNIPGGRLQHQPDDEQVGQGHKRGGVVPQIVVMYS